MQSLLNNMCFYNIWQRSRRVCLRAIGLIVALFSSTHARAYLSTACPWCSGYGDSICDMSTAEDYSDGRVIGRYVQACIPAQNKGLYYPQIQDSSCVKKLQAIGMCDGNEGGSTVSFLYQSGLNCSSGVISTPDYYTTFGGYNYQTTDSYSGYVEMATIDSGATSPYICCNIINGAGTYNCCIAQSSCLRWFVCGYCDSGYNGYVQVSSNSDASDTSGCTAEFQEYFGGSQISTGWCDPTTGDIMVEGTGALLISHFCYGTDYIPQDGHLTQFYCGMIIEGCENANGYYVNKTLPGDPYWYGQSGYTESDYCPECPDDTNAPWWCGISYSIYSTGTGIESCYAAPSPNPLSPVVDSTGTFEVSFPSDCQYQE